MLETEINSLDVMYNNHMMNIKQIDYKRKENRADFHIKQRDNYIEQLKEQLNLRDRIIRDKLGTTVTTFLKNEGANTKGVFSMKDIEMISQDLILPSLKLTRSNNFLKEEDQS
jgi:hypothetical protein